MGKTNRKQSDKAIKNAIAIRKQNIQRNIRKFNKLTGDQLITLDLEKQELLTNIYLDTKADLEILRGFDPKYSGLTQLDEQVKLMENYVESSKVESEHVSSDQKMSQSQAVLHSEAPSISMCSKSSVKLAAARIQAAEVDTEIKALRRQYEDECMLKELESKLHAQKLRMKENELVTKKELINQRRQLLEEHDLDEREEITHALEHISIVSNTLASSHSAVRYDHNAPKMEQKLASNSQSTVNTRSEKSGVSDMHILAESIAKAMRSSRLPVPDPPIFTGNPLEYVDWEISFRTLVESSGIPDADKIHYLKKYVAGPAKEAISGAFLLKSDMAYLTAKQKLKDRFGSDFAVAEAFRSKLQQWPKLRANDHTGIQKFADFLGQCQTAMQQIDELAVLNDSQQNIMLMSKLPDWLANRWKRQVVKHKKVNGKFPKFEEFVKLLGDESDIVNDPTLMSCLASADDFKQAKSPEKPKSMARLSSSNNDGQRCTFCNIPNHRVTECKRFANKTQDERKSFVQENKLCWACLKPSHRSSQCRHKAKCTRCSGPHPTALHFDKQRATQLVAPIDKTSSRTEVQTTQNINTTHNAMQPKHVSNSVPPTVAKYAPTSKTADTIKEGNNAPTENKESSQTRSKATCNRLKAATGLNSMIVPVWLSSSNQPDHEVLVYALLDTMSDTTFVTNQAVAQLDTLGQQTTLKLTTMTSKNKDTPCMMHNDLTIRGYKTTDKIKVPCAYTRDSIPLDRDHISTAEVAKSWAHLKMIACELPKLDNVEVGMLIGYDTSRALIPLKSITGDNVSDPYAVQTPLGWSIVGQTRKGLDRSSGVSHLVTTFQNPGHVDHEPMSVSFAYKVNKDPSCKEIIDLLQQDFSENSIAKQTSMSKEDQQFVSTLTENTEQTKDGFYSMPLPFKNRPEMPNNLCMAKKRFELLRKKLANNPQYQNDYISFMNSIIESGDAELVLTDSKAKPGRVWYIPHFGVYHPKKPDKIRVVFDCSAKFHNECLNDHLLQGPDVLNSLIGVLHRFRKGRIVVMCDIQRMFHMFKVHESDRDYLRFLWFKDDSMSEVAVYRIAVHLFGATSSPGCATFGLRQLATDKHNPNDPYSVQAKDFMLHDFYVDDGLISLDSQEQAVAVINRAIDISSKGNIRLHKFVSNDKKVLRTIPSSEKAEKLQDLDLQAANSTLPIERALGIEWCVENDQFQFRVMLKSQATTRRGILSTIASVFDPLGFISPFILMGKQVLQQMCRDNLDWDDPLPEHLQAKWQSRTHDLLALNRQVTVARAELQAAVLSAKIAHNLKAELKLANVTKEVFWTDSKVVLGYIHNEARRFHVYVANRVQQICNITTVDQWHHISTNSNPADIASRGATVAKLVDLCWFTGPEILWNSCFEPIPPAKEDVLLKLVDPEVKAKCHSILKSKDLTMAERLKVYSKLSSAVRAVRKLQNWARLKKAPANPDFGVQSYEKAKLTIMMWAQQDGLTEYEQVKQGTLNKSSTLAKLDPFIDASGVMRVGGRLKSARLPFAETHPVILPKNSHVKRLVIAECHEKVKHQGKGMTMCEIRSAGFWVIGLNSMVASYIHKCVSCRKQRRPTETQKMADLPSERVTCNPPFTCVGCDCFGPFVVKENRKEFKRYGVIFTCMASRAIHIEVIDDMSADAFINALRCFIAIRGPIRQIHTDRGTNFIGAANELRKALAESSNSKLSMYAQENNFDFVTNIPHSSHMGGVWERHIHTIRSILNSILMNSSNRLDTSTLRTFLYETMAIVNCRPLTAQNSEDKFTTALSPNQLLTMKSKVVLPPPGKFDQTDAYSRKRWRVVQSLANTFWSRWRKEYLQTLQARQKWTEASPNIEIDDIVILKDETKHRNHWSLARVIATIPSKDGLVRKVKLLMADSNMNSKGKRVSPHSIVERPIHKLVFLCKPVNS
ncbi:uncharacterized protein [Watersipora subatra]|uniref:uncharacterized protein n=1 Tax=Watersipora subatra TaxID=2589382 RepID=UPI00355BA577